MASPMNRVLTTNQVSFVSLLTFFKYSGNEKKGNNCVAVGNAVDCDTRGLRFKSSHWKFSINHYRFANAVKEMIIKSLE